jgi:serine phosphatase RsbU (regulator of sigma subunit)
MGDDGNIPRIGRSVNDVVVPRTAARAAATAASVMRLLLVEDDEGDAVLVTALLEESGVEFELTHVTSLLEARKRLHDGIDCVLLDLGLPDAQGLDALHALLHASETTAVVCMTGLDDEYRGVVAVAAGAQDYLIKGQVDAHLLRRAVQYAIERRHTAIELRALYRAQLQAAEYARLERGLLPHPRVSNAGGITTWYRPGRDAALGGDFYDVVELDDGTLCVLVGDVAGHGPDEAALGVCLRIAWRALVLAGIDADDLLPILQGVLVDERRSEEAFVTVAMAMVRPDRGSADIYLAGHPAPLLLDPVPVQLPDDLVGPALGIVPDWRWQPLTVDFDPAWRLMLFTDGLIEVRIGAGSERLDVDGLLELIGQRAGDTDTRALVAGLVDEATKLNGGDLADDVAVVVLSQSAGDDQAGASG